jgi:glucan phosphoethanolaminetransferase (alkaline phosphatase superfamily)
MFDGINLPETITVALDPRVVWIALVIFGILYAILTAILVWHWNTFSYSKQTFIRASRIYYIVSAILIVVAVLSATYFTL